MVALSLWEVCATRRDAHAVPDDDAWRKAAAIVRSGYHAGDLIVFAPDWADPIGRLVLGDLIPLDVAARMDGAKFARIWEVSIRDAHAPETAGLAAADTREVDGVTVRRFEREPAVVTADILAALPTAQWKDGRGTLELAEVGFAPHRCIQIIPPVNGATSVMFAQLPLGTHLVGYVGLADVFHRRDIRAPGTLTVAIAGTQVATATAGVDDGWVRFEATTTPGAADVTFTASATAPDRRICFAAEARR